MARNKNLIYFVPPSELGLDLVPYNIVEKGRIEENPRPRTDQCSLGLDRHDLLTARIVRAPVLQLRDPHDGGFLIEKRSKKKTPTTLLDSSPSSDPRLAETMTARNGEDSIRRNPSRNDPNLSNRMPI